MLETKKSRIPSSPGLHGRVPHITRSGQHLTERTQMSDIVLVPGSGLAADRGTSNSVSWVGQCNFEHNLMFAWISRGWRTFSNDLFEILVA
jgi:hypothetical protein